MSVEGETEARLPAGLLRVAVTAVFERCGMSPDDAGLLADTLVEADLRAVHSHGLLRVPEYVKKLTADGVNPQGRPHIVRDEGACLVVDGGNSMGQIGAAFAMEQAIARAVTTGVAAVAVRGSNHCGAMAWFACQTLPHDMIGIATSNALPTMAPWGSAERILGINPLAIAIPTDEELPLVYDGAFSMSAHGKIRILQQQGKPLPEGWALDIEGRPTTDHAAALAGMLAPVGGAKGTALALMMGILSCHLSGALYGTELGSLEAGPIPGEDSHFMLALRVSAFEEPARFKSRVDAAIREIHASRPAEGVDRIYVPGEPEWLRRQEYIRDGVPLTAAVRDGLETAFARFQVTCPW